MTTTEIDVLPSHRKNLLSRLTEKLEVANHLNRQVVSFQANKDQPVYRWFKYKEGFSSTLVKYFIGEYAKNAGRILDPFAGAGTTLFAAQQLGWQSYGIELLPVGAFVMQARAAANKINIERLKSTTIQLLEDLELIKEYDVYINHITITKDAFPIETEIYLNKYLTLCSKLNDNDVKIIMRFAAFSILEEISFTRKDGQYLRWDYRSVRNLPGKPFDKGKIKDFKEAINFKLNQIIIDLVGNPIGNLFEEEKEKEASYSDVNVIDGSCLEKLPQFEEDFFDFIITSPPYCNRYDYTRTYALELVFLGYDHSQVRELRQAMLSCTVENKDKINYLKGIYEANSKLEIFNNIINVYNNSDAMTEVNETLDLLNVNQKLNNSNVARMVKNYFLEMCFVIYEMSRITKKDGYCVMVNDNVRYGGEEIPVDLILSDFAESFGFNINKIFVLPKGKGNSSQQMGEFGRSEVRKCVYLWQKNG